MGDNLNEHIDYRDNKLATEKQVGGSHYKDYVIQPFEFFTANNTPFPEANACKYILRHQSKGKEEDLDKAIHCIELIKELRYG